MRAGKRRGGGKTASTPLTHRVLCSLPRSWYTSLLLARGFRVEHSFSPTMGSKRVGVLRKRAKNAQTT